MMVGNDKASRHAEARIATFRVNRRHTRFQTNGCLRHHLSIEFKLCYYAKRSTGIEG